MGYLSKKRFSTRDVVLMLTAVILGMGVFAYATVKIPNTFTSGTAISSSAVNANFTSLANQMPAVKQVKQSSWLAMSTTAATLQSITVTPPGDGYVIVRASGSANSTTSTTTTGYVCLDLSNTAAYIGGCTPMGGSYTAFRTWVPATTSAVENGESYSIEEVFAVTGSTSYTYYLSGSYSGFTTATYLFHPTLTVLFVPNALP